MRLRELSYKVSGDCRPKQFCEFCGGKSMLAHTRDRLQSVFRDENIFFVLNHAHRVYYRRDLAGDARNYGAGSRLHDSALSIGPSLPRKLTFPSYYRSGIAIGNNLRRPSLNYRSTCNLSRSGIRMDSAPPDRPQSRLNGLQYVSRFWEKPNLEEARALQKSGCLWNTFAMVGSRDAFLGLLGATAPHLLAAIGDGFSAPDLDRIYREIELIDFSKEVLSAARSVSWYCATGLLVGRILAAHEEPGTCSILSPPFRTI
jgi:hypothetical protein